MLSALVSALAEKVGSPYDMIPPELMLWGEGGGFGVCALCGALAAGAVCFSMIAPKKTAKKMFHELCAWYEQSPFPSDIANKMAHERLFPVEKPKSTAILPQTVSRSVLCHVSVSVWCKKAEVASGSKQRSERCARLTSDVAAHTVDILNRYHAGNFKQAFGPTKATQECMSCHEKGRPYETGGWTRGKMECGTCHDETPDHAM